ncbi:14 kDa proline-rich protein DC2.15-like [Carica papaya]|uniref:14 kDa proline-rich protein DC2.15-like n=1 Tax=Carica papaya TaxID=3649 RepID=UPI000B8D127A|nr:14 kDa proline-rich protein DC2.15-like [Carica papaya]
MGSKALASTALLLCLNLVFFNLVSSTYVPCPPTPPSGHHHHHNKGSCPRDALKFGVCANVLNLVKGVVIGQPPYKPCCSLIEGLIDLEAAVCLCTAIKASVLGIDLNIPVSLSLVLNNCGKKVPKDYKCE